jgi:molybdopterin-containing oxidoreductase family molybdopterin binding subunit
MNRSSKTTPFEELKDKKFTRRTFIKGVGTISIASSIGFGSALQKQQALAENGKKEEIKYVHGLCTVNCTSRCHLKAHVKDGRIVTVTPGEMPGRPDYANCCLRSVAYSQRLQNEDERILYPMKRVGKRGERKFERITWKEALETIANKLNETKKKYGPESAAFFTMTGNLAKLSWEAPIRFANCFGGTTYNIEALMSDHGASMGMQLVFGQQRGGHDTRDYMNSKLIILWGRNVADTHTSEIRYIIKARENGAKVIVIDPRQCSSAAIADQWIPIRAGGDTALALGMMNIIISKGLHDKEWLSKNSCAPYLVNDSDGQYMRDGEHYLIWDTVTNQAVHADTSGAVGAITGQYDVNGVNCKPSFEHLVAETKKYTLEKTSEITGIEKDVIETLTMEYITAKPAGIRMGQGMQRVYNSHSPFRTVATLAAVAGYIGIPGGGASHMGGTSSIKPIPGVTVKDFNYDDWKDTGGNKGIEQKSSLMYDMAIKKDPYPIDFLWIAGSNFLNQNPNPNKVINEVFPNIPFIVNVDPWWTWTSLYADIILPGNTYWEKWDFYDRSPWVFLMQPAIGRLGESKSDVEIFTELAPRVGLGHLWKKTDEEWVRGFINPDHPAFAGFNWDTFVKEGVWARKDGIFDPVYSFKDQKYKTPTGKFQFYSEDLKQFNQEVPTYTPGLEDRNSPLAKKYPLSVTNYHDRFNVHSQHVLEESLQIVQGEPEVWMNTLDAKERGIKHGDVVKVYNDRGSCTLKAFVTEGIIPGVIGLASGWQPKNYIKGHHQNLTRLSINPIEEHISQTNTPYGDVLVEVKKA